MEEFTIEGKAVGLVLDISRRQESDGTSVLEKVKKAMIQVIKDCFAFNHDALYLYHRDIIEPTYRIGEHNSSVGNYMSDGVPFNLNFAFKQTLYVIAQEDEAFRKYIVFITDRVDQSPPLEKLAYLNEKERIGCRIIVIGVGDHYDKAMLSLMSEKDQTIHYQHIDHASEIVSVFLKEKNHGDEDVCSTTNEFNQ